MALQLLCGVLYQQKEIHLSIDMNLAEDWRIKVVKEFEEIVSRKDFPCVFGRKANTEHSCLFLFVDSFIACDIVDPLVKGFIAYTQLIQNTPVHARLFQPLIVFFSHEQTLALREQHQYAWSALKHLHVHDPAPWPDHIPQDPHQSGWSFCFNGVELFINISAPGHHKMRSRNLGSLLTFVVNPRENFDVVASQTSKSGVKIRENIRQRVAHYNDGFTPTTLGFFHDMDNVEWKQYQLHEPGALEISTCPFHQNKIDTSK